MVIDDMRTEEQKKTHSVLVVGTDSFMSYWGKASDGTSLAGWACRPEDERKVLRWVKSRMEMCRVRVVRSKDYRPNAAHLSIYYVNPEHPALS